MKTRYFLSLPAVALAAAVGGGDAMAGKANDTLVWTTDRDQAVADPYYNNTRELVIIGNTVWDGLLYRDPSSGEYKPLLAKSFKWLNTTSIEFELRDDVVFHNGAKFGADDVVYTINYVSNKDNGVLTWQNVKWMKNAKKTGANKVQIDLNEPFPAALAYFAQAIFMMPKGHYDKAPCMIKSDPAKKDAELEKKVAELAKQGKCIDNKRDIGALKSMGTGPFKIDKVIAGDRIIMSKNAKYFAGAKEKPKIGNLVFRTIKEKNTQIAELLTGGVDWIWDVPKDQAEKLEGKAQVVNAKTFRISYIQFDVNGGSGQTFFKDKRVRQAVAHAINRDSIVKNLVGAPSEIVHSACHPEQFGCTQDVPKWAYDPAEAKKLLAEAGHPNGFTVDLYAYRERHFTEAVIGDLAKVGIKANLKYMQFRALRDLVWKNQTPVNQMTWGSNSIPDVSAITSHFFSGGRDDFAKDPEVIKWLQTADTSVDAKVRQENYKKALAKISGELYWLPMFTYAKYYAWAKDLDFKVTSDEIPQFNTAKWK